MPARTVIKWGVVVFLTFVTSDQSSIDGKYIGADGVREFLSEGLELSERERAMTVDEIRPVGGNRPAPRCRPACRRDSPDRN